jgi:hypothetical protein
MPLLHLPHFCVPSSTSFQQSAVITLLGHPPLVQHNDFVGVLNGAQSEKKRGNKVVQKERKR